MKFKFKVQGYQTEAVESTCGVFSGQPFQDLAKFRRDLGESPKDLLENAYDDEGYRNADIQLTDKQILENLNSQQAASRIPLSTELSITQGLGRVNLDIEMETGTGKTYVYIKTMFELNKRYGWSKFIIVVPSIAIREGVAKSFRMLEDHFMELYGKKARWFVYNSANLTQLDHYSQDSGLNVMVINTQAFATSLKQGGKSKESKIIHSERDEFASRRPIDVIAANHPIIIMDEPQKMGGASTQDALKRFKPLFILNYSATHKTKHNTIYALDALDAYRERLVKRIRVIGFELKNLKGANGYIYLEEILLSPNKPPQARISFEIKNASGELGRRSKTFNKGDSLFEESNELREYSGYTITDISPDSSAEPIGHVTFSNGTTLRVGEVIGDSNELQMQRIQIRETIKAHFERERQLFKKGIKCLSLFFIDEVAKYRAYDKEGNPEKGIFQKIFEEEYEEIYADVSSQLLDDAYRDYIRRLKSDQVHRGYFSIDKKSGVMIDRTNQTNGVSEEPSDFDLILRDKERLLSFEEPTRFIFSHSALREGWDNPNVFQICMLRHSNSVTARRQEVGRGLRLCVDKNGIRQDKELLGEDVHDVNVLTVVANESYADFVKGLQQETQIALRERPLKATTEYFKGKTLNFEGGNHVISDLDAAGIIVYLGRNGYINNEGEITSKYSEDRKNHKCALLDFPLQRFTENIFQLVDTILDPTLLEKMAENGAKTRISAPVLNSNFYREEFKALWGTINHQYVYTVSYGSNELIKNSIDHLNNNELKIRSLRYTKTEGKQDAKNVTEFGNQKSTSQELPDVITSSARYDLIGQIAKGANLTRRTTAKILQGLFPSKFALFRTNPEEFITKVVQIIREQKATMIVDHIHYHLTDGTYDSDIFTAASNAEIEKVYQATKNVTNYLVADSKGELNFAKELDAASEVVVYAKLPRSFKIPTPVGSYSPDWAIAMQRGDVKHIFFIAETKGSLKSMQLSGIEKAKIECCSKLFEDLSNNNLRYHEVTCYQDLLDALTATSQS